MSRSEEVYCELHQYKDRLLADREAVIRKDSNTQKILKECFSGIEILFYFIINYLGYMLTLFCLFDQFI